MSYEPKQGTPGYARVVARGCGGSRDYWGEFDCDHAHPWTCDDCPWRIENEKEIERAAQAAFAASKRLGYV
ncbi:hypothetical protein [Burkholderia sp. BCC0322]|uniref:hypothetical protein n=1 Tax=unclassified Burkholderia TaxID=2613784 RepID=UPI0015891F27|nr:hypothetical protein [Burkholderia sp. BCC0322]